MSSDFEFSESSRLIREVREIDIFDRPKPERIDFPLVEPLNEYYIEPKPFPTLNEEEASPGLIADSARGKLQRFAGSVADKFIEFSERNSSLSTAAADITPEAETPITPPDTRQADARAFRRNRLRTGAIGDLVGSIPKDENVRGKIRPFLRVRDRIMANTHQEGEHHRDLAALFSGLLGSSPELRQRTMRAIDETATQQSEALKQEAREQGTIEADLVIVGAGIQGAILSAKIRAEAPDARIVIVDERERLGGQFRKYGDRPIFYTNGRNHRPQANDLIALPGSEGNLNSFGTDATIQLTDISTDTYPHNLDLGDAAAVNIYLSAETMLDSVVFSVDPAQKKLEAYDQVTNEKYTVRGKAMVIAPGQGERENFRRNANEWTAEEVLSHFADDSNEFPMDEFIGKKIALKGGGDTGRVIAELFSRLAPPEAYGNSIVQLGGPESITWFGTNFDDRDEFCNTNRPRYNRLASFISSFRFDDNALIEPVASKISGVYTYPSGEIRIATSNGDIYGDFDVLINASDLPDMLEQTRVNLGGTRLYPSYGNFLEADSRFSEQEVAKTTFDGMVYVSGPAAQVSLTPAERSSFADGIIENTASMWANGPRAELLGSRIGTALRQQLL